MNDSSNYLGAAHWAVTAAATTAVTQIVKFVKPTSDLIPSGATLAAGQTVASGGSTTTLIDAGGRTEKDDYWNGKLVSFTSGANSGQVRLITDFVDGTDTITFAPAVGTGVANLDTYDLFSGTLVNRLVITGYAISCYNTNAAEALIKLRSHITTAAIALRWVVPRTTGHLVDSCSDLWIPLVADEHLELNTTNLTGLLELTVFGRTISSQTPVSEKYDMSA